MWFSFFVVLLAVALDYKFAEVARHHPLVYFGNGVQKLEQSLNLKHGWYADKGKLLGIIAWCLAVMPLVWISYLIEQWLLNRPFYSVLLSWLFAAGVLYFALGWRSLIAHAKAISVPLKAADMVAARRAVAMIVSRDSEALTANQIGNAASESVLENGADAIFAAIFWFLLLGVPGIVLYRLANTLDAMWGYKHRRYVQFGWAAARIDDVLNYLPARLVALSYALLGNYRSARRCWKRQGVNWKSPNAGPVMAAGAGALNLQLGGGAMYQGKWQDRPLLGPDTGLQPGAIAIDACCLLVGRVLALWLLMLLMVALWF